MTEQELTQIAEDCVKNIVKGNIVENSALMEGLEEEERVIVVGAIYKAMEADKELQQKYPEAWARLKKHAGQQAEVSDTKETVAEEVQVKSTVEVTDTQEPEVLKDAEVIA